MRPSLNLVLTTHLKLDPKSLNPSPVASVSVQEIDHKLPEKGLFSVVFNLQVPASMHYSMGSWIVRQSVGSTPCLLGKAVDCNYIRGPKYLEVDVDIGSSTVANGVLGLVIGVITTLVVDMAFLVQANTTDELPERLIGAVRVSHIELSSAITPKLEPDTS
ncbi:hypothetical protein Patl1_03631 [Pistacia atlantica]|uniref:Uncharacterized protein n=1 Tax=Pistacia atlantica TaxID=434234 RepID=A0ACC1CBI2_9ROSI|nr:hypothetical protein Patl1_03631 [Pistacia atlantica]